ncbi:CAP domain-containing protein [Acidobacteria bacterium AB60]|nr:CAP domain-containing protein [Acidobacteria bacterium AB60]
MNGCDLRTREWSDTGREFGFKDGMTYRTRGFLWWTVVFCLVTLQGNAQRGGVRGGGEAAEQLFALANQARARAGAPPLVWDAALAAAAQKHCARMVAEGPISHRYGGEPELSERASMAGAHFSLIEENVALGSYPAEIHEGWMNSPGHRRNLLNPEVDRVGIAVIAGRGELYAVADYTKGVVVLSRAQVEEKVGALIHTSGLSLRSDPRDARAACEMDRGIPGTLTGKQPGFIMRWQSADLGTLPQQLVQRMGSREYHLASVGACTPQGDQTEFTQFRVAVLLY